MTAHFPGPIQAATVTQLLSGETRAAGAPSSYVHVENLCEGGAYVQRLPFRLDIGALDAPHWPAFDPYFSNTVSTFDPIRHLAFKDALVVGQGSVVTRDFCLVSESAYEFIADDRVPDGLIDAGAGRFALETEPSITIDRSTLLLKRPWNANYGHWLVDSAAMLALGAGLTLPPGWQLAIGRQDSPAMQRIVRQTLDIVAPGVDIIELPDDEIWRFSDLHYVTPIHVPLKYMVPAALSALRALVLRDRLANEGPRRGIYVTRGEHGSRQLRNEDEVIALCRDLGLDIVRPEASTLVEQARLFRQASLVVGVKGAALTNSLFCSSGTHLVVLSPGDFPDPFYWDLTAPAGIGYSEIFGVPQSRDRLTGHNAFTVSVAGLRTILEACLTDLASPLS
jgi:capsular polysaccharide biosynthesis protein